MTVAMNAATSPLATRSCVVVAVEVSLTIDSAMEMPTPTFEDVVLPLATVCTLSVIPSP
jgi:hypothetical protein